MLLGTDQHPKSQNIDFTFFVISQNCLMLHRQYQCCASYIEDRFVRVSVFLNESYHENPCLWVWTLVESHKKTRSMKYCTQRHQWSLEQIHLRTRSANMRFYFRTCKTHNFVVVRFHDAARLDLKIELYQNAIKPFNKIVSRFGMVFIIYIISIYSFRLSTDACF